MEADSPLLAQLVDPGTDIFLNIPQHVAEDFAPMLRLMLGSFLVSAQLIEVNEAPRARRLLIIDEAAKLGNMDILENIRDRGRSRIGPAPDDVLPDPRRDREDLGPRGHEFLA